MSGQLSLVVEPDDRESAEGYFLRCCAANRVAPVEVYRWLGLPWCRELRPEHLPALAEAMRIPLPWLRARTPVRSNERKAWDYAGWRWRAARAIHRGGQRLCPLCVHRNGLIKLEWALTFVTICPRHRCLLMDTCGHCGRAIQWRRPAVDVCVCKRHFAGMAGDANLTLSDDVEYWLQWVSDSLQWRGGRPAPMLGGLVDLMPGGASPDGVWRLLWAFGVRSDAAATQEPLSKRNGPLSPRATLDVVQRGFARLRRLLAHGDGSGVHLSDLKRQASLGITAADRQLAAGYVTRIGASGAADRSMQMDLFA
jgi:TniQ